jgi:hypothetical protein
LYNSWLPLKKDLQREVGRRAREKERKERRERRGGGREERSEEAPHFVATLCFLNRHAAGRTGLGVFLHDLPRQGLLRRPSEFF